MQFNETYLSHGMEMLSKALMSLLLNSQSNRLRSWTKSRHSTGSLCSSIQNGFPHEILGWKLMFLILMRKTQWIKLWMCFFLSWNAIQSLIELSLIAIHLPVEPKGLLLLGVFNDFHVLWGRIWTYMKKSNTHGHSRTQRLDKILFHKQCTAMTLKKILCEIVTAEKSTVLTC